MVRAPEGAKLLFAATQYDDEPLGASTKTTTRLSSQIPAQSLTPVTLSDISGAGSSPHPMAATAQSSANQPLET